VARARVAQPQTFELFVG